MAAVILPNTELLALVRVVNHAEGIALKFFLALLWIFISHHHSRHIVHLSDTLEIVQNNIVANLFHLIINEILPEFNFISFLDVQCVLIPYPAS